MTICRMDDADNLSGQLMSKKPGAFAKWIILTVVFFFLALTASGFAALEDSLPGKLIAAGKLK